MPMSLLRLLTRPLLMRRPDVQSHPALKKQQNNLHVFPSKTALTTPELELALRALDEGLSQNLDLWSVSPPPELQKLSPEDWGMVAQIWEQLLLQQQHSSLH